METQSIQEIDKQALSNQGFTISELMVATAILGITITMAWGGLIAILEANQRYEAELDRHHELSRALDFIMDDIYTSQKISRTVTLSGPSHALFELTHSDGTKVAYFMAPKGTRRWKGPYILFRRSSDAITSEALVDGISNQSPICLNGVGEQVSAAGIKIFIQDESSIRLCLVGHLPSNTAVTLSRFGTRRGK